MVKYANQKLHDKNIELKMAFILYELLDGNDLSFTWTRKSEISVNVKT